MIWNRTIDGLHTIHSDYVFNTYDMSTNNLTISGNLISPITNLLNISYNILDNKINNLTTTESNHLIFVENQINNYKQVQRMI